MACGSSAVIACQADSLVEREQDPAETGGTIMKHGFARGALLAALAVAIAGAAGGATAQTKLVASLQGPIETSYGQAFLQLDRCLKERTNGQLTVDIYPNGQLGDLTEAFEQVRQGSTDLTAVAPGIMAEFVPEVQVFSVPFIFRDLNHWEKVVTGPVGEKIGTMVHEKAGVRVVGYFGGSMRQLMSKRPILRIEDVKGLSMRLLPGDVLNAAWTSVGAVPTVLTLGEVYNALQLGVVQGLDMEPEWMVRMKFHEQAPHVTLTSHEIVTRLFIFSEKRFTALSPPQRMAITECAADASAYERKLEIKLDQETLANLVSKHGVKVAEIDREAFARVVQPAVDPVIRAKNLGELVTQVRQVQ
jgi:tripartite ATP-independent transporter DctP family solute receptor